MSKEFVQASVDDGLLTVRLNRADKMNALTPGMIEELHAIFSKRAPAADVRCVLITGTGRGFCAGRDLSTAAANEDAEDILNSSVNPMLQALYDCPKPTVAAVNGVAMGIGLGLALCCDIVYAADSARFSSPFANLGGALDSGGHYFLPRLIGEHRALELIYTANVIEGRQAERWGLINRAVSEEVLLSSAEALARRIVRGPLASYMGQKQLIRRSRELDLAGVLREEAGLQGALSATPEYAEGVTAFREKRAPDFRLAAAE